MSMLAGRPWVPEASERYIQSLAARVAGHSADEIERDLLAYVAENRAIHERDWLNLKPANNAMNAKAEALLSAGIGSRPSLGYPGDKYEMGLEGIEKIEVLAAELAAEIFGARYAEIRVGSGALANLYVFMMAAKPGDVIIAPPPSGWSATTDENATVPTPTEVPALAKSRVSSPEGSLLLKVKEEVRPVRRMSVSVAT